MHFQLYFEKLKSTPDVKSCSRGLVAITRLVLGIGLSYNIVFSCDSMALLKIINEDLKYC